jgi:Fic family protein
VKLAGFRSEGIREAAYSMEKLVKQYQILNIEHTENYEKFNNIAISAHSTRIEGSTLTLEEARLLIEQGLTPKNKPLIHSLMVIDHYKALQFTISQKNNPLTVDLIQKINAYVMQQTGNVRNTPLGTVDESHGDFRLGNVTAGGHYFPGYEKVPNLVKSFVEQLNRQIAKVTTIQDKLLLSFAAHFDLVNIHPFYDGNGRTSRLLMSFIQAKFSLPLGLVFSEDKLEYYETLRKGDEMQIEPYNQFMLAQYQKHLTNEIEAYAKRNCLKPKEENKGNSFSMFI